MEYARCGKTHPIMPLQIFRPVGGAAANDLQSNLNLRMSV
jgi:hypothetical protein